MIRLDEFYSVEPDTACWALTYEKVGDINPNTGKPTISRDVSYHVNLNHALAVYLDNCLKPSTDLQDVKTRIQEAVKNINAMELPAYKTAAAK